MTRLISSLIAIISLSASLAYSDVLPPRYTLGGGVIHGAPVTAAKAASDTINLMSTRNDPTNGPGEPYHLGDFENAGGGADWNGWTSLDITQPTSSHWQVSNFMMADPANLAAWCGDINIPSCDDSLDPEGGYGNAWHDQLEFTAPVLDTGLGALVTVTATLYNDTEPGYDFTYLSYQYEHEMIANIQSWDGADTVAVSGSVPYLPGQYVDGTDIRVLFRFKSDGGWSDADCTWPTVAGAARVDDITLTIIQTGYADQVFFEDFQGGDLNLGDGMSDPGSYSWRIALPSGVGDFAKIWQGLQDVDPCVSNYTPQVAFIDDGIVVPGTGGSDCVNWCYGPGGYIVTTLGGLAGPTEHIYNAIESPVMDWPAPAYDGALFTFGVYRHEDLTSDAPGIFYTWGVRSADTDGNGGNGIQVIEDQPWLDRNFVYFGGPDYIRAGDDVTNLMNSGRDQVQIQLAVYELGFAFGWTGNDGYPAPYFDNVKFQVYDHLGPGMSAREIDLANDGFPERGSLDYQDLGSMHVRFDMAQNISLSSHQQIDYGDTIVVDIKSIREGAEIHGTPEIRYILDQNPLFDPYRSAGMPAMGAMAGAPAVGASGFPDPDGWAFDLPDTGFLFPGDVLHYYIYAEDSVEGADIRASIIPADTTGFSTGFGDPLAYSSTFTIRALPTIEFDGFEYSTPPMLFWNDFANRGGENEWYTAFNNAGQRSGDDYDIYYTNGPSSGVGNGLGGRAGSDLVLEYYSDMIYTSGDLGVNTISNADYNNDGSDDVGVLTSWLLQGNKDIFLTGDDLASSLSFAGETTLAFAEDWMGVALQTQSIRSYIDNQTTPLVRALPGNPVFQNVGSWIAFGACPAINTFDGVTATSGAQRLAEFTDPAGLAGAYEYSAATMNIPDVPGTSRVLSLPYDFMYIYTDPSDKVLADRSLMLRDVISWFGIPFGGEPTPVTPELVFSARNYPNPFNPVTKIFYTVPRAGHLSLKVFDIRGRLVKTLVDDRVEAGADQVAVWDGRDSGGGAVSSGVYFYEVRTGSEVKVGKMALVK